MIKSVTISPYESNSEIGVKSRSLVKDLSSCDNINNTNCSIYDRQVEVSGIQELPIENPDLCIQYVNYENFVKTRYTNVGVFEPTLKGVIEQENFLRLLDKIVVRSHSQKKIIPKPLRKNVLVARPTVAKAPKQLNFINLLLKENPNGKKWEESVPLINRTNSDSSIIRRLLDKKILEENFEEENRKIYDFKITSEKKSLSASQDIALKKIKEGFLYLV